MLNGYYLIPMSSHNVYQSMMSLFLTNNQIYSTFTTYINGDVPVSITIKIKMNKATR